MKARVSRQSLTEALERTEYQLNALLQMGRELARARCDETIFRIALATMMGAVGATRGSVLAPGADGESWRIVAGDEQDFPANEVMGLDVPTSTAAQALVLSHAQRDCRAEVRKFADRLASHGFQLWVPLAAEGEVVGGVCLAEPLVDDGYAPADVSLLASIAAQCASSLQSCRRLAQALEAQQQRFRVQALLEEHVDPQIVARLLASPGEQTSERRTATILVADIRDFTPTSERLPPEDVVGLLNRFLAQMTRVTMAHGGIVDKFIGDAIMVLFDDPADGARRAVLCAQEMQGAFRSLRPRSAGECGDAFSGGMGIGISTGEVVFGAIGGARRMDFTMIGTPVNLAHRLSSIALAETVIDQRTHELAGSAVEARLLGPLPVKGISRPQTVYRLVSQTGE